jgi:ABC-2 type transport system permease protein
VRYPRLWRRFLITAIVREAEYRVSFLVAVVEGIVQVLLLALTFELLYQFTGQLAGWTRDQVLILVGVYRVADGLIALQVAPNMQALPDMIRTGELDFHLMRPASSQFLVSTRRFALPEAVNVLIGLAVVAVAGARAGVTWDPLAVASALALLACGVVLLYALWFAIMVSAFWWVQVGSLDLLFESLFEAARYPVDFFSGWTRLLFTFAFPVAFATTFPTEALLGQGDAGVVALAVLLAAAALTASHLLWRQALRQYESASS